MESVGYIAIIMCCGLFADNMLTKDIEIDVEYPSEGCRLLGPGAHRRDSEFRVYVTMLMVAAAIIVFFLWTDSHIRWQVSNQPEHSRHDQVKGSRSDNQSPRRLDSGGLMHHIT